jgi:hypothetical protein
VVLHAHLVQPDRVRAPRELDDVRACVRFRCHEYPERKVVTVVSHLPSPDIDLFDR